MKHPLRQFRETNGLSRDRLGELLGVTGMTIYRWERGERMPQPSDWTKIETVTGVSPAALAEFRAGAAA